jgi:hypothetical protein
MWIRLLMDQKNNEESAEGFPPTVHSLSDFSVLLAQYKRAVYEQVCHRVQPRQGQAFRQGRHQGEQPVNHCPK